MIVSIFFHTVANCINSKDKEKKLNGDECIILRIRA